MRNLFSISGGLVTLIVLAVACQSNNENNDSGYFRYNESAGISSLDPAFAKSQAVMWPVHQLYNTLVETGTDMRSTPGLAKSWVFSDDQKNIRFTLRTDVYFHDDTCFSEGKGRKMTSSDVVFSLGRIMDPATASPGAWIFNNRLDSIEPFRLVNDSVFELRLARPFQPILGILSMKYCSIVAPEAVASYGKDFGRHPVGTGPFAFVAWHDNEALILKRHQRYFERDESGRQLPYLKGIRISFYDSKLTEFLEFRQGKTDFINDIDASVKDEVLTKTGKLRDDWKGTIRMQTCPYLNIEYLGILTATDGGSKADTLLANKLIRQAIGYCINRRKMLMYLRNSVGASAEQGFLPPGLPSSGLPIDGFGYDPEKARKLIVQAGYGTQKPMPLIRLLTVPNYASLGTYLVNDMRQVGISAEVEVVQKSVLLSQMASGQVPFFRGSWIADYPDAENYLSVFYGKNPAPPNYTRYRNAAYDQLYERAIAEASDSIRFRLYHQMDSMIMADVPVIPLWYDQVLHLVRTDIQGLNPNSLNMLELRRVSRK